MVFACCCFHWIYLESGGWIISKLRILKRKTNAQSSLRMFLVVKFYINCIICNAREWNRGSQIYLISVANHKSSNRSSTLAKFVRAAELYSVFILSICYVSFPCINFWAWLRLWQFYVRFSRLPFSRWMPVSHVSAAGHSFAARFVWAILCHEKTTTQLLQQQYACRSICTEIYRSCHIYRTFHKKTMTLAPIANSRLTRYFAHGFFTISVTVRILFLI